MPNTVFIGKDLPDGLDFAKSIANSGRTTFACMKTEADTMTFETQNIFGATWSKSSALSAYSFFIKAESKLQKMDEVIFYFDTNYFVTKFDSEKTDEIAAAVDIMICSYMYACAEFLKRIDKRREKTSAVFLLRDYPSKSEILSSKSSSGVAPSATVSAAQEAFVSLAESFAANVSERNYLSVMLARCSQSNELYKSESNLAAWLATSMDALSNQKNPQTVKQACSWNKAGFKIQSGLFFLR
ncbi:MAG: hypothetical protein J1E07_06850 [Treponema sp.]|nr:hypothetical protein [Treponema sp.]